MTNCREAHPDSLKMRGMTVMRTEALVDGFTHHTGLQPRDRGEDLEERHGHRTARRRAASGARRRQPAGRRRCAGGSPRPGSPVRRTWRRYTCCGHKRHEAGAQAELEEDAVDLHVDAWHGSLAADPLLTAQILASDRWAWG